MKKQYKIKIQFLDSDKVTEEIETSEYLEESFARDIMEELFDKLESMMKTYLEITS